MDKTLEELIGKAARSYTPIMSEEMIRASVGNASMAQSMADAVKALDNADFRAAAFPVGALDVATKHFAMSPKALVATLASAELEKSFLNAISASALVHTSVVDRMAFNSSTHALLKCSEIEKLRCSLEPGTAVREFMKQEAERQEAFERAFRLPLVTEYARLAANAIASSGLANKVFSGTSDLLSGMMTGMNAAWLRAADAQASAVAFADIQAIGRLAASIDPFDSSAGVAIRANLGDWRDEVDFSTEPYAEPVFRSGKYLEHGFDPSLTDFPVPAFKRAVEIAGLDVPQGGEDDGLELNTRAYRRLFQFEIEIREFIVTVMHDAFGERWMKQQLPTGMLDRWMTKKEAAEKAGGPELSPIEYADFSDYKAVIERKDNWERVFKHVFGRQDDVRESFQRLFPVRIATMHSRIITLDDDLLLSVETRRILGAVKKSNCRA